MNIIKFTISDMLRGKCVFLSIEDILETFNEIKVYINKKNLEH